jgi:hypothetical protein
MEQLKSFKEFFNESSEDSQYLLQLGIENTESVYKLAYATKNPEELKKVVIANKTKLIDDEKINYEKINWEDVFNALKV